MAKDTVSSWDQSADNNTDVAGINIAENCPPSGINNAIRAVMAQIAVLLPSLARFGAAVTNDFLGAVAKRLGNASTIHDAASVERSVGYRDLPLTVQRTAAYTIAPADVGMGVPITAGGITVPANATAAFSTGSVVIVLNTGAASQSITPASGVTLTLAGTSAVGNRALAQNGLASLLKVGADSWFIYGVGVG